MWGNLIFRNNSDSLLTVIKTIGYNPYIMRQIAYLVVNPITLHCTAAVRASDLMTASSFFTIGLGPYAMSLAWPAVDQLVFFFFFVFFFFCFFLTLAHRVWQWARVWHLFGCYSPLSVWYNKARRHAGKYPLGTRGGKLWKSPKKKTIFEPFFFFQCQKQVFVVNMDKLLKIDELPNMPSNE